MPVAIQARRDRYIGRDLGPIIGRVVAPSVRASVRPSIRSSVRGQPTIRGLHGRAGVNQCRRAGFPFLGGLLGEELLDRKSTRLNSSHVSISYAVFCLKKKYHSL